MCSQVAGDSVRMGQEPCLSFLGSQQGQHGSQSLWECESVSSSRNLRPAPWKASQRRQHLSSVLKNEARPTGGKGWVDQETNMWIVGYNWGTRSKWLERVWEAAQIWDYRDGHRLGNRVCTLRVWCFSNSGLLKKKTLPQCSNWKINILCHKCKIP